MHTPAYTLRGLAIQILSVFSSESIEQDYGATKKLDNYKDIDKRLTDRFECSHCDFGKTKSIGKTTQPCYDARTESNPSQWPTPGERTEPLLHDPTQDVQVALPIQKNETTACEIDRLPKELLLLIIDHLEFDHLTKFAAAWPKVSDLMIEFDVVRQRELQCFCLKKDYRAVKLGVGVEIQNGYVASEFDFISQEAFHHWKIRESINRLGFQHWLPLPISHPHWRGVRGDAVTSLRKMNSALNKGGPFGFVQVLIGFMNDVVVRLNQVKVENRRSPKSNLRHASEKAIESYFHLFHLLICLAVEDPSLVKRANSMLLNFKNGKRSKADCPSLGHLLVTLLISDVKVTEEIIQAIIAEAITRNVVWLLDKKGANLPELSHMETQPVSAYRLDKTFEGSRTSYRLLMFSELFRRTARPSHQKPLSQVCDELFERHGAPPRGAAQELAEAVRRVHTINNFPAFLKEMGIAKAPNPASFTTFLRKTIHDSMEKGYSVWGMKPAWVLVLRRRKDPSIHSEPMTEYERHFVEQNENGYPEQHCASFFPKRDKAGAPNRGRGGRRP